MRALANLVMLMYAYLSEKCCFYQLHRIVVVFCFEVNVFTGIGSELELVFTGIGYKHYSTAISLSFDVY